LFLQNQFKVSAAQWIGKKMKGKSKKECASRRRYVFEKIFCII
jgi:hypothetical protein